MRLLEHAWQRRMELLAVGRKKQDHIGFGDIAALLPEADLVVHNGRCTYHREAAFAFDLQSFSNRFVGSRHRVSCRPYSTPTSDWLQYRVRNCYRCDQSTARHANPSAVSCRALPHSHSHPPDGTPSARAALWPAINRWTVGMKRRWRGKRSHPGAFRQFTI
jgi:hypothetical protein